jgi:hypothetical protein
MVVAAGSYRTRRCTHLAWLRDAMPQAGSEQRRRTVWSLTVLTRARCDPLSGTRLVYMNSLHEDAQQVVSLVPLQWIIAT